MKLFKITTTILVILAFLFLFGCEKDQNDSSNNMITEQIGEVETTYKEGDVKIEFPYYPGFQKNEKVISESYALMVRQELNKSYSKQTTYLKSAGNTVGVIKEGTCGSYQELYIHLDCEDSGAASSESGWNGDCWVNSAGNVILFFCVVDGAYFQATNVDYAVLNLSSNSWPSGVSKIRNFMDTENHSNINEVKQGGTGQTNGYNIGGINKLDNWYGETGVTNLNALLGYYYYPKILNSNPFPNLNISYGVFGNFSANKGTILVDNEDGAYSWVGISLWTNAQFSGLGTETYPTNGAVGVVKTDGNSNTTMYFSKVN